ncbi:hypothetical protein, partial [Pseudomonas viridiflava]|uniref:hypothetical protein n=1 Tax=Pseudomonas viridiflava TaxID=33069 RepID=UPI00197FA338
DDAITNQLAAVESEAVERPADVEQALEAYVKWASTQGSSLIAAASSFVKHSPSFRSHLLVGPTGERNTYTLLPRERVLCLAENKDDLLVQIGAVLSVGSLVVLPIWSE